MLKLFLDSSINITTQIMNNETRERNAPLIIFCFLHQLINNLVNYYYFIVPVDVVQTSVCSQFENECY